MGCCCSCFKKKHDINDELNHELLPSSGIEGKHYEIYNRYESKRGDIT